MRNRLLGSVVLCALAVVGAGAPGIAASSADLTEAQDLVDQATVNQDAIALAYALSDERDAMVAYVAGGRTNTDPDASPTGPDGESGRARVDRLTDTLLASGAVPGPVRQRLKDLPALRRQALSGSASAYDVYVAYSDTVHAVQRISRSLASGLPGRAENATAAALPYLGHAVEQASAVRGLLRGALTANGPQKQLTAEAQQAHVTVLSALADFRQTAGTDAQETLDQTVTGADVGAAERYLDTLTDQPSLDAADRSLSRSRIADTLAARIDRMRSVHSSLATAELHRLEQLRDDDVKALEIHIAIVGFCLLVAVGISVSTARSMARPLSVLRRGSARVAGDPAGEEPVRFSGRNDEFAEVVRSLNDLRATAATLAERAREAEADNSHLITGKDELAAERERLLTECRELRERVDAAPAAMQGTFLHLAVRTLGLVERQLGVIESMEADESDPDRLGTLFTLDHLATRMRRHGENLLLLAGTETGGPGHPHGGDTARGPVPLLDVLRAAVSEIERYDRVALGSLPPHAQLSGHAADDVSHLVAELLDNATSFSPPDQEIQLSGWMLENGEIMLSVQDEGIGMTGERLNELNTRLGDPAAQQPPGADTGDGYAGLGNGLYVVARLAARHGLRVQLRRQRQGGIAAVVILPRAVLPDRPVPGVPSGATAAATGAATGAASAPSMPGSVAEANSNTLPTRQARPLPPTDDVPAAAPRDAGGPEDMPAAGSDDWAAPGDQTMYGADHRPTAAQPGAVAPESGPGPVPAPREAGVPDDVPAAAPGDQAMPGAPGQPDAAAPESGYGPVPASGDAGVPGDVPAAAPGDQAMPVAPARPDVAAPEAGFGSPGDQTFGASAQPDAVAPEPGHGPVPAPTDAGGPDGVPAAGPGGWAAPSAPGRPDVVAPEPGDQATYGADQRSAPAQPGAVAPEAAQGPVPASADAGVPDDVPAAGPGHQAMPGAPGRPGAAAPESGDWAVPSPRHAGVADGSAGSPDSAAELGEQEFGDAGRHAAPATGTGPAAGSAQGDVDAAFGAAAGGPAPRVTDKGLPKRTPRHVAAQTDVPRPRKGGANADELRRRLGGFQRGARDGHRDAAAETAAERPRDDEEARP